jgi:hypothetical protein
MIVSASSVRAHQGRSTCRSEGNLKDGTEHARCHPDRQVDRIDTGSGGRCDPERRPQTDRKAPVVIGDGITACPVAKTAAGHTAAVFRVSFRCLSKGA